MQALASAPLQSERSAFLAALPRPASRPRSDGPVILAVPVRLPLAPAPNTLRFGQAWRVTFSTKYRARRSRVGFQQQSRFGHAHSVRPTSALRAGVLRRAVSLLGRGPGGRAFRPGRARVFARQDPLSVPATRREHVPSVIMMFIGRHRLRPNPSLNRTRHGMPARPGRRYAVHFRQPGLAVMPRRAG
jgi:hypothetical protein